jgi:hypothetical protein
VTEVFLAMVAAAVGLPVLVACVGFAFRRSTRFFVLPPLLGVVAGAIVALSTGEGGSGRIAFIIVFSIVTVPLAIVAGVVALVGAVDARWPKAVPRGAAAALAIVVLLLAIGELDRPGSEPTRQWTGTVRNQSVAMLGNGMVEDRMEVALDDGRTVKATAIRQATLVPFERVRVHEYRSVITGRSSYTATHAPGQ